LGLLASCGYDAEYSDDPTKWEEETWSTRVDTRLRNYKQPVLKQSQLDYSGKFRVDGDFGKIFLGLKQDEQWMNGFLDQGAEGLYDFCPHYTMLDEHERAMVWMSLLDGVSFSESGYAPQLTFKENFVDSKGDKVVSTGLFQLSVESAKGHKETCSAATNEKLKDAAFNFACAVRVMSNQVQRTQALIFANGKSYYWSVLSKTANPAGFGRFVGRMAQLIKDGERWPRLCGLPQGL
jgi:hypothetical protein